MGVDHAPFASTVARLSEVGELSDRKLMAISRMIQGRSEGKTTKDGLMYESGDSDELCSQWEKFRNALERQLGSIAAQYTNIEQNMQPMQPELPKIPKISASRKKELCKLWCKVVRSVRSSGSCHDSGREAYSTTERCRRMRGNKRQVINWRSRETLRMAMKSRKKRRGVVVVGVSVKEEEEVKKSSMTR